MRRLRLVVLLVAAASCQNEPRLDLTLPPTEADVTGTFFLAEANGVQPPFDTQISTTSRQTLTSDAMYVAANNTWADTTNYIVTNLADGTQIPQQTASAGTYTIANGQINFVMTVGGTIMFQGAVNSGSLIVNYGNKRFIYTK